MIVEDLSVSGLGVLQAVMKEISHSPGWTTEPSSKHFRPEVMGHPMTDLDTKLHLYMSRFADGEFAAVLSNATLEQDPYFWKTVGEIHRVTSSGGFIAIGVPGYAGMGFDAIFPRHSLLAWLKPMWGNLLDRIAAWYGEASGDITLMVRWGSCPNGRSGRASPDG
jgi:hypothetical protein